jgi:hypothetical protein
VTAPSIGRIIIVRAAPGEANNNAEVAPAVITHVFGGELPDGSWMVNARVLLDGDTVTWRTSLSLFADQAAADAAKPGGWHVGWWPPRA